ncbi:DUF3757 domain-containing protein [Rickettsiella endosymbiont of Miltochrista miniata]|uniref:DUF3757 domain-containing protein n=1 Tax=Rickettsiella endosymbiont of Miltochrista miniata TaxID=3066239 RepID=UPI00313C88FD
MKVSKISLIILLAASISQTSFAFSRPPATSDTCPAEDAIKQIGATYTAPGGWTGVVQNRPGKVKAFDMALYKPSDIKHPFQEGRLLRCAYKLDNGNFLDLRLPTLKPGSSTEPGDKANITNSKNWQAAYGGNQYDCSQSRLACEFHLSK